MKRWRRRVVQRHLHFGDDLGAKRRGHGAGRAGRRNPFEHAAAPEGSRRPMVLLAMAMFCPRGRHVAWRTSISAVIDETRTPPPAHHIAIEALAPPRSSSSTPGRPLGRKRPACWPARLTRSVPLAKTPRPEFSDRHPRALGGDRRPAPHCPPAMQSPDPRRPPPAGCSARPTPVSRKATLQWGPRLAPHDLPVVAAGRLQPLEVVITPWSRPDRPPSGGTCPTPGPAASTQAPACPSWAGRCRARHPGVAGGGRRWRLPRSGAGPWPRGV